MVVSVDSGVLGCAAAPAQGPGWAAEMCGWISRGFAEVELWLQWKVLTEEPLERLVLEVAGGQSVAPVEGPG